MNILRWSMVSLLAAHTPISVGESLVQAFYMKINCGVTLKKRGRSLFNGGLIHYIYTFT